MTHRAPLSQHVDAFKDEALMLLRFYIAFKRILKFKNIQQMTRIEFVDNIIALKAIENDLVLRISKFDDDTRGVHSFRKVIKEIPSSHINKLNIVRKIEEFRVLIKKIKQERRNEKLAHLKIGKVDNEYDPNLNLLPAIKMIVEIIDMLSEKEIAYEWKDGRYEHYDLRKEIFTHSFANTSAKLNWR